MPDFQIHVQPVEVEGGPRDGKRAARMSITIEEITLEVTLCPHSCEKLSETFAKLVKWCKEES